MSEAIQPRMIDFKPHEIPLEDFDISQRELWSEDLILDFKNEALKECLGLLFHLKIPP